MCCIFEPRSQNLDLRTCPRGQLFCVDSEFELENAGCWQPEAKKVKEKYVLDPRKPSRSIEKPREIENNCLNYFAFSYLVLQVFSSPRSP